MGIGEKELIFILFGYSWSFSFLPLFFKEKINSKKYKFSLIRLCFLFQQVSYYLIRVKINAVREMLARIMAPLFLVSLCWLVLESRIPYPGFYVLWGSCMVEGFNRLGDLLYKLLKKRGFL